MDDLYIARNAFAVSDLPPAPARHGLWMRRFNQFYAWGVAVTVGAIIGPQYLYLVTLYLHGPVEGIAQTIISPDLRGGIPHFVRGARLHADPRHHPFPGAVRQCSGQRNGRIRPIRPARLMRAAISPAFRLMDGTPA